MGDSLSLSFVKFNPISVEPSKSKDFGNEKKKRGGGKGGNSIRENMEAITLTGRSLSKIEPGGADRRKSTAILIKKVN